MEISNLPIDVIRIDGGTQSRVSLNESTVAEYVEFIRAGGEFPPVIVFEDGTDIWLGDGFHRFHAYRQFGAVEILCDVRSGTLREAKLFSCGANSDHGMRRTNEDKRKAVMTLLNDAEWKVQGIRWISRQCAVSEGYVHKLYHEVLSVNREQIEKPEVRTVERNGKTYEQNTSNIGKATPVQPKPTPVVNPEKYEFPTQIKEQEPSEIESLKAEIADLHEVLAMAEIDIKQLTADNNKMGAIFDADDRVSAMAAELKKQTAIALVAETTLFTRNNEFNAALKQAKLWESKFTRLEKQLKVAA